MFTPYHFRLLPFPALSPPLPFIPHTPRSLLTYRTPLSYLRRLTYCRCQPCGLAAVVARGEEGKAGDGGEGTGIPIKLCQKEHTHGTGESKRLYTADA